mgnify:CR=1 FL=1
MLLQVNGATVEFIGDPHMGKKFNDVPLHRRGEREKLQLAELVRLLNTGTHFNINVGDLFDTFDVEIDVLMAVFNAYRDAVKNNPLTQYYIISGNHDISRNAATIHSFDVLKEMLRVFEPRIRVFTETTSVEVKAPTNQPDVYDDDYKYHFLFCPYSAFKTSTQEVTPFCAEGFHYDLVVGHWDVGTIAGPDNLVPKEELFKVTDLIVTGHEHTAQEFKYGDKRIIKTGSMQPYSHSEDAEGIFYVTHTLEQVKLAMAANPDAYANKCLRLVLAPDEESPGAINCLQFAVKRIDTSIAEIYEANLDGDFSFSGIFYETFKENGLSTEVTDKYFDKYKQEAAHAE